MQVHLSIDNGVSTIEIGLVVDTFEYLYAIVENILDDYSPCIVQIATLFTSEVFDSLPDVSLN